MLDQVQRILTGTLLKSKKAARLYLNGDIKSELLEECVRTLHRQVALDLYFSKALILQIENKPFVLNKLFELKTKGGNIYETKSLDHYAQNKCIGQVDFKSGLALNSHYESMSLEPLEAQKMFDSLAHKSVTYRPNDTDIEAKFESQSYRLLKETKTTISWSVSNADSVFIDGLGEVPHSGKQDIRILNSSLLTLTATNRKRKNIKAIYIDALDQLKIHYDVFFFNPSSKEYVSLKTNDNSDGVFGVSKEHKIKFTWRVESADRVDIQPFAISHKSGEVTFMPEETIEINIKARLQGQTSNERIIIHPYPMPVFAEKLVDIKSDFNSRLEFQFKDVRNQAHSFLETKQSNYSLEELRTRLKQQERILLDKFQNLTFANFYQEHSLDKLNHQVIGLLKAYFSDKPEIQKMLDSLPNYHD